MGIGSKRSIYASLRGVAREWVDTRMLEDVERIGIYAADVERGKVRDGRGEELERGLICCGTPMPVPWGVSECSMLF